MRVGIAFRTLFSACLLLASACVGAQYQQQYRFDGVERVVAIGDLHGDYEQYLATLRSAGLVNKRGRWSGGKTHLVQTGDVPDRGADSRKIIDHLAKIKKQAARKGGHVHTLIGNHEAMNFTGDLRYVHPGEYEAFATSRSGRLQDRYFVANIEFIQNTLPEDQWPVFDESYRLQFNQQFPLGYVEHRRAWLAQGQYGAWVLDNPVAIVINDSLFLHGGIACKYNKTSLDDLTRGVWSELLADQPPEDGLVTGENGPLWYRGLAQTPEAEEAVNVAAILENFDVARVVIGHTPQPGIILPRFDGAVVMIDTGISGHYGGQSAYLEIGLQGIWAGYGAERIELPGAGGRTRDEYIDRVSALYGHKPALQRRLERLKNPDSL